MTKNYKANEDPIILEDGLLSRVHFVERGSFNYYQFFIPKQLANEVLRSLRGDFGKHPRITKQ